MAALALFLLWTFTYYRLPISQWKTSISARPAFPGSPSASEDGRPLAVSPSKARRPPRPKQDNKAVDGEHYYDGDIMFYMLPKSLNGIARTYGHRPSNQNVLFAASSLKSVAVLIPLACDMAKHVKNYVHLTVMGRSDLSIQEILEINGVDKAQCKIFWHDARPDYAAYSTETRAEASVSNALMHFKMFMHPQAIITDGLIEEDGFFVRALKRKSMEYNIPLIELPANKAERLAWLTRLEARALAAWHNPTIDVLIQVQPDSTGSLIRLLTSLHAADFAGLTLPRLSSSCHTKLIRSLKIISPTSAGLRLGGHQILVFPICCMSVAEYPQRGYPPKKPPSDFLNRSIPQIRPTPTSYSYPPAPNSPRYSSTT